VIKDYWDGGAITAKGDSENPHTVEVWRSDNCGVFFHM